MERNGSKLGSTVIKMCTSSVNSSLDNPLVSGALEEEAYAPCSLSVFLKIPYELRRRCSILEHASGGMCFLFFKFTRALY